MPWLDDVLPQTTIRSVWGNTVRNQLVQSFANVPERDSHAASLPDGALAYCIAEDRLFMRRAASPGGWRTMSMPYTSYTPGVRVGANMVPPANILFNRRHYRRVNGTTIHVEFWLGIAWGGILGGAVQIDLPVWFPVTPTIPFLWGGCYLVDFDETASGQGRRVWFPIAASPNNQAFAPMDPATGNVATVSNSMNFQLSGFLTYEGADG